MYFPLRVFGVPQSFSFMDRADAGGCFDQQKKVMKTKIGRVEVAPFTGLLLASSRRVRKVRIFFQ